MSNRTYVLSKSQAYLVHAMTKDRISATHNYIVEAVKRDEIERARQLITDLDMYKRLFAATNVDAHELIDAHND